MGNYFDELVRETILFLLRETKTSNKLFANETGLSAGAVSNYLKGRRTPTAQALCSIADFFGASLDELCGRVALTSERVDEIKRRHISLYGHTERVEYAVVKLSDEDSDEYKSLANKAHKESKGKE